MRSKHIQFIIDDIKERGEKITSDGISFIGALYHLKVKKEGDKRSKTVNYSAAENVMDGYRAIRIKQS